MFNIVIEKVTSSDKESILEFLDDFRTFVLKLMKSDEISITAQSLGGEMFDTYVNSQDFVIFIAKKDSKIIGIISISRIPVIRKGIYHGEVQDFFILPEYHGAGIAQNLMKEGEKWCCEKGIVSLKLESDNILERAHGFYKKYGFINKAKRFELEIK